MKNNNITTVKSLLNNQSAISNYSDYLKRLEDLSLQVYEKAYNEKDLSLKKMYNKQIDTIEFEIDKVICSIEKLENEVIAFYGI